MHIESLTLTFVFLEIAPINIVVFLQWTTRVYFHANDKPSLLSVVRLGHFLYLYQQELTSGKVPLQKKKPLNRRATLVIPPPPSLRKNKSGKKGNKPDLGQASQSTRVSWPHRGVTPPPLQPATLQPFWHRRGLLEGPLVTLSLIEIKKIMDTSGTLPCKRLTLCSL